ncbi:MAG: hypothetical protein ACKV0T_25000 [Planctomycetales bacterium]
MITGATVVDIPRNLANQVPRSRRTVEAIHNPLRTGRRTPAAHTLAAHREWWELPRLPSRQRLIRIRTESLRARPTQNGPIGRIRPIPETARATSTPGGTNPPAVILQRGMSIDTLTVRPTMIVPTPEDIRRTGAIGTATVGTVIGTAAAVPEDGAEVVQTGAGESDPRSDDRSAGDWEAGDWER